MDSSLTENKITSDESMSAFTVALHRAYAENIKLCLERKQCEDEYEKLTNEYALVYERTKENAKRFGNFDENVLEGNGIECIFFYKILI